MTTDDSTFRERHALAIASLVGIASLAVVWAHAVAPFFHQLTHEVLR